MQKLRNLATCIALLVLGACHTYDLHSAVGYQNLNDVKKFISDGADINAQDGYGNTPLMLAAQANNYVIAKYLIDNGAQVDKRNGDGWSSA